MVTLGTARTLLHKSLQTSTGEPIVITPSQGGFTVEVCAVRGQSGVETHTTAMPGYTMTAQHVDWIIAVDNLDVDYVPQANDLIEDQDGGEYRVLADPTDQKVWRWSGPGRTHMRIHSKVEAER